MNFFDDYEKLISQIFCQQSKHSFSSFCLENCVDFNMVRMFKSFGFSLNDNFQKNQSSFPFFIVSNERIRPYISYSFLHHSFALYYFVKPFGKQELFFNLPLDSALPFPNEFVSFFFDNFNVPVFELKKLLKNCKKKFYPFPNKINFLSAFGFVKKYDQISTNPPSESINSINTNLIKIPSSNTALCIIKKAAFSCSLQPFDDFVSLFPKSIASSKRKLNLLFSFFSSWVNYFQSLH